MNGHKEPGSTFKHIRGELQGSSVLMQLDLQHQVEHSSQEDDLLVEVLSQTGICGLTSHKTSRRRRRRKKKLLIALFASKVCATKY